MNGIYRIEIGLSCSKYLVRGTVSKNAAETS
jgi:hypothetical protein